MSDKLLYRSSIELSPKNTNGGECLILTTEAYANRKPITDEDEVYYNQKLSLESYGNSASINLYNWTITPEMLRDAADQLEKMNTEIRYRKRR